MRLAYIALSARGGTALYSLELARQMARRHEVLLVVPEHMDLQSTGAAAIYRVPTGRTHWRAALRCLLPTSYYEVVRSVRRFRPDLVHFPLTHPWNRLLGTCIGWCRTVGTIHDPVPHEGAKYRRLTGAIHSAFCRHAQAIVCLSEFGRASLARTETPRRLVVIPHPCFTHYAALAPPQAKRTKVTFFGRIEEYKGVEYFLSAAARLAARYPEIEFVVAGTATTQTSLALPSRSWNGNDPQSCVLLYRRGAICWQFYSGGSAANISSTQSGVVAAAYGCGCPVIATDVGGLPEVVLHGKTGLLVPPRDVDRLTGAIDLLLSQPGFASALGSGAKQFSERELGGIA